MQEQLADDLQRSHALSETFNPKTLAYPGVTSRLELGGSSVRQLQEHREKLRLAQQHALEVHSDLPLVSLA